MAKVRYELRTEEFQEALEKELEKYE